MEKLKILILEDNKLDTELIKEELTEHKFDFGSELVETEKDFITAIHNFKPDIILSDYSLPQFTGFEALEIAKKLIPDIPFIIVTGSLSEEMAADSIKKGAWDYILKENLTRLIPAIENALKLKEEKDKNKRAEEALKESEKKFRMLAEQSGQMMYDYDIPSGKIKWSGDIIAITGYTVEEFQKIDIANWEKLIHADDRKFVLSLLDETMNKCSDYRVEYRFKRKNGKYTYIEDSGLFLADENGKAKEMLGLMKDITSRKQAEEELKAAHRRLDLAIDAGEYGFWDWNLDTDDVYFSPRYYTMLGYEPEELPMRLETWVSLMHPEDQKTIVPQVQEYVKNSQPYEVEFRLRTKDGGWCWISGRGKSFDMDERGNSHRALGIHVDITDRKKAEESLRQSEEKYRRFFATSKDVVYITSVEGKFLDINDAGLNLFGIDRETLDKIDVARDIYADPADRTAFAEIIDRAEYVTSHEVNLKKMDGTVFPATITVVTVRDAEGNVTGYQGIIRDETERKHLESQFLQAQKMEAIGTLAGGIAHDFNNMIQVILGYTQIMMIGKKPDNPDYSRLEAIGKVALRAVDLAKQILLFSRKGEINLRPMELNLEVRSVCKLLERSIPKMINIELHLAKKLKIINADPAQIEQIMMNLGVNARDAMPDGGKLVFETENVILDEGYCKTHMEATSGEYVMLSVSDTGHGMDKEIVEHIFEPFFTTKELGKGTGLGLSTVYGIVKRHGGHINCYSEPRQGTTFKLYFPIIEQEREVARGKEAEIPVKGGNETILLVDDEESIRELGETVLVRFGYTVVTASDGESALEIYRQQEQKIDLVLLDLIMPGMGGRRCLEEILKIDPEAKVTIASGYSVNGKLKEVLESGTVGFIGKPYNIRDMLRKVREVLDK